MPVSFQTETFERRAEIEFVEDTGLPAASVFSG